MGNGDWAFSRLTSLKRLCRSPGLRLISVDLYDTLVLRRCRPELLRFRDIAEAQHAALLAAGSASPGAKALYYARLRVHKACHDRARMAASEFRHAELIDGLCAVLALPQGSAPILAQAEIGYELAAVRPSPSLVAALVELRADRQVVVASDMYLPATVLRRLLAETVPPLADVPLFVSAELGLTKRHGQLFQHMAETMAVAPRQILHLGDHPQSDVARAREAGLTALWWPRPWWWRLGVRGGDRWVRWRLRRAGALAEGAR